MNTASMSAALVTTMWVWVGFKPSDSPTPDALSSVTNETGIWKQPLVSSYNSQAGAPSASSSWKALEHKKTVLDMSAAAAAVISSTLKTAAEHPGDNVPNWQIDVAQRAHKLWSAHHIIVSFVDRETFGQSGLRGCCTASRRDPRGRLEIMVGVFGDAELRLTSWATVQGRM